MPKKNDFGLSRSSRKKEQRLDRFLNWAIIIVVACILVVGGYLLVSILNTPDKPAASSPKTHTKDVSSNKDKVSKDTNKNTNDTTATDDTNNDSSGTDGTTTDSSDDSTSADLPDGSYDTSGGSPDGPWHPIGTTQTEPHQKNYDMGGTDWNEQVKALSYATGIPEDQMTVKWLGNGGSPDTSLGKVYSKLDPGKVYDVQLQWVTDKGWEPTSVTEE